MKLDYRLHYWSGRMGGEKEPSALPPLIRYQPYHYHLERKEAKHHPLWHILASRGGACSSLFIMPFLCSTHLHQRTTYIYISHSKHKHKSCTVFMLHTATAYQHSAVTYVKNPHRVVRGLRRRVTFCFKRAICHVVELPFFSGFTPVTATTTYILTL